MNTKSFQLLTALLIFLSGSLQAQDAWDNTTRALYILDIAKYVEYDDDIQSHADFKIGVLGKDNEFAMDLYEMAKTRKFIQQKPIKIFQYPELDDIEKCHILYVNKNPIRNFRHLQLITSCTFLRYKGKYWCYQGNCKVKLLLEWS